MSCKRWQPECMRCLDAVPDYIPEVQVANWAYRYREKLINEDSIRSGSACRSD